MTFLFLFPLGKQADTKIAQPNPSHPAPEKKKTTPVKPAGSEGNPCTAVCGRPYRDRVIHLLALRTYKKPELLARLQRDGIRQKDKGTLGKILQQVRLCSLFQQYCPPRCSFILDFYLFLHCINKKVSFLNIPCSPWLLLNYANINISCQNISSLAMNNVQGG